MTSISWAISQDQGLKRKQGQDMKLNAKKVPDIKKCTFCGNETRS